MANDIIDMEARSESLMNLGWVSYILHLVVAIGAVLPGTQASVALLLLAFILDLVKKGDATGSWQASHFEWQPKAWRIHHSLDRQMLARQRYF